MKLTNVKKIKVSCLLSLSIASSIFGTGCWQAKIKPEEQIEIIHQQHQKKQEQDIDAQLSKSAQAIEQALTNLAMVETAKQPPVLNTEPLVTPEGNMGRTATIDWVGPVEPLLAKIADMTGYNFKIIGRAPKLPIIVSINAKKTLIADIVKNASLQVMKQANILVFPNNNIIELRYLTDVY